MVIEHYRDHNARAVYQRFREKGRMMPEGLSYVASWVEPSFNRCFQVMECVDEALIKEWSQNWDDLIDFEITRVLTSAEAAALNE